MTETNFDEFVTGAPSPRSHGMTRIINVTGAVTSLALLFGVGIWGYKLAVRDVTGVPVIEALAGPMRIAPEDPGGKVAAHLGLSVNRIAAEGRAGAAPDRLLLAPPPIDLAPEDMPGVGAASAAEPQPTGRALALAEELLAGTSAAPAAPEAAPQTAVAPVPPGALARSPRPQPRPGNVSDNDLRAVEQTGTQALPVTEIDPASLRPGTRLAQIGAFDSLQAAREAWDRVSARAGAVMQDKGRVIQIANSGGSDFYRLRVHGFSSEDDSRRFCSAVETPDTRCIPVTHR